MARTSAQQTAVQLQVKASSWLKKAGAGLVDMGYIQLLPVTDPENGTVSGICQGTAIYVNTEGKRFVNEMGRRDELFQGGFSSAGRCFLPHVHCERMRVSTKTV